MLRCKTPLYVHGTPLCWLALLVTSLSDFAHYWFDLLSIKRLSVYKNTGHLPFPLYV